MYRYFIIISFILVIGCKEVYDPDIDNTINAISVQGMLTDIPGQASVTILKTVPYDSIYSKNAVSGASVIIYDNQGNSYPFYEDKFGKYTHPSLVAEKGRTYHLKIITKEGDTYESDNQTLPKSYNQDTIYAEEVIKTTFVPNTYGEFKAVDDLGIETYVDISSAENETPKVLYDTKVTAMYSYPIPDTRPPQTMFGWRTVNPNAVINITSSKFEKSVGEFKKHSIGFFSRSVAAYCEEPGANIGGFWITVNKYNLSMPAYQYYLDIKDQLSASGRMFDPTPSQLRGNLKCTSNPDKKVFGFFELTNAEKYYFRYKLSGGITMIQEEDFPEFSESGESLKPPAFFYR